MSHGLAAAMVSSVREVVVEGGIKMSPTALDGSSLEQVGFYFSAFRGKKVRWQKSFVGGPSYLGHSHPRVLHELMDVEPIIGVQA